MKATRVQSLFSTPPLSSVLSLYLNTSLVFKLFSQRLVIMEEINWDVFTTIRQHGTIRVVADIRTEFLSCDDYLNSALAYVQPFVSEWEQYASTRVLAVEVWPRHSYVVIDINNHRYDFEQAHKQRFILPVYILRLSRRSRKTRRWRFYRCAVVDRHVATELALAHYYNDRNPTPFLINQIEGPDYDSRRAW